MDKRFFGILALIVVGLVIIFAVTNHSSGSSNGAKGTLTNHVEGKGSTGVKLVEYGDYQCPACGSYYPLVKQVQAKYQDQIFFQFRNFPLIQLHQNAMSGARAAEAADMQGKFWEMHDKLYEENGLYYEAQNEGKTYSTWINSSDPLNEFTGYATALGLDTTKFKQDYASSTVNDRIQADLEEGNKLKVNSTPTFFLDGKKISNPTSLDEFSKVIDSEIKQKTGKDPAASTTPSPASNTTATPEPAPAQ
jgi:protein-disulfide isomerase